MDQINVTEDADGSEDGQQGAREYAKQQAGESVRENMGRGYQFRYLSSTAVDSGYYADTEQQGVDVSYHQGYIDWAQVKASGMEFAMIRVGNLQKHCILRNGVYRCRYRRTFCTR